MKKHSYHIRAVLFDLDGVVVFTDRFHELGWRRMAADEGWDFPAELAHSLRGVSRMEALDMIAAHNKAKPGPEKLLELADRKNTYYKDSVQEIGERDVLPGVLGFIRKLRELGVKTALCSASKNAPDVLKLLDIEDLFDVVVCGLDITRSKPDPQVFTMAAEKLGVPGFHCLVFEDAPSGVEAARRAGMKCVGVGTPEGLPDAPSLITSYDEIDIGALLDSGRPYRPVPHGWQLWEGEFRPVRSLYWESMLAVTNGVIGVRGNLEEENQGVASYPATQINGVVGYIPYHFMWKFPGYPDRGHRVLNACEWTRVTLEVDGERFDMRSDNIASHSRWLDMKTGAMHREFAWKTKSGVDVTVRTRRIASMNARHLAAHEYELQAGSPCAVKLVTEINAAPESRHYAETGMVCEAWETDGAGALARQVSATSGQKTAAAFRQTLDGQPGAATVDGSILRTTFEKQLAAAGRVTLSRTAAFFSCIESADPVADARKAISSAPAADGLFAAQADFWAGYWERSDIAIEGDDLDQLGVRLSLFHNRQSNPEDGFRSVSANGQTGDNYGGHIFWDTEMYIAQPFYYTEPETARGLLEYRHRILDKAREQARRMQNKGALFSWNSITGEECAHVYEASTAEYHLQSAVAWAVNRYVEATGDRKFLEEMGAEMVFETARFLRDRGCFSPHKDGRFVINVVCGPNEYSCGVDNNAYTNYLARWHFQYAARLFRELAAGSPEAHARIAGMIGLDAAEAAGWQEAADRMYLPWDEKLGIIAQDDSFLGHDPVDMSRIPLHTDVRSLVHPLNLWRMQLIKQADTVLVLFLFRHLLDGETVRKTYEFHEPKTNHGSSLSACMHCIVAADLGLEQDAYHFFRESALMDINDLKGNTDGGVHSACLGGTWMAVVNGYGGMRDTPDGLVLNPTLPANWTRLSFPLQYRGTRMLVERTRGETTIRHLAGDALDFTLHGRRERLEQGAVIGK